MSSKAAIIAQVAITALSLPEVGRTHWTVQAAFIISLVTGALCVFYCCTIQASFGSLIQACDIKDWLCKPGKWDELDKRSNPQRSDDEAKTTRAEREDRRMELLAKLQHDRWKSPSINAVIMLVAPDRLLYVSVGMFLVGLGVYLVILLHRRIYISVGVHSTLGLLLIYFFTVVWGLLLFYTPAVLKLIELAPSKRGQREANVLEIYLEACSNLDLLPDLLERLDKAHNDHQLEERLSDDIGGCFTKVKSCEEELSRSQNEPSKVMMDELHKGIEAMEKDLPLKCKLERTETGGFKLLRPGQGGQAGDAEKQTNREKGKQTLSSLVHQMWSKEKTFDGVSKKRSLAPLSTMPAVASSSRAVIPRRSIEEDSFQGAFSKMKQEISRQQRAQSSKGYQSIYLEDRPVGLFQGPDTSYPSARSRSGKMAQRNKERAPVELDEFALRVCDAAIDYLHAMTVESPANDQDRRRRLRNTAWGRAELRSGGMSREVHTSEDESDSSAASPTDELQPASYPESTRSFHESRPIDAMQVAVPPTGPSNEQGPTHGNHDSTAPTNPDG